MSSPFPLFNKFVKVEIHQTVAGTPKPEGLESDACALLELLTIAASHFRSMPLVDSMFLLAQHVHDNKNKKVPSLDYLSEW